MPNGAEHGREEPFAMRNRQSTRFEASNACPDKDEEAVAQCGDEYKNRSRTNSSQPLSLQTALIAMVARLSHPLPTTTRFNQINHNENHADHINSYPDPPREPRATTLFLSRSRIIPPYIDCTPQVEYENRRRKYRRWVSPLLVPKLRKS